MRNKLRTFVTVLLACVCIVSNATSPMMQRLMKLPRLNGLSLSSNFMKPFIARNTGRPSDTVMSSSRASRTEKECS